MELITLETVQANPLAVFTAENGLDPYLNQIKAEVDAFVPDMSTKKGQEEIRSFAYKIARSSATLDKIGKDLKDQIMDQPKKIDEERRRVKALLKEWQDQVRAPLTEFEEAEKARIAEIQKRIDGITALPEQLKEHGSSSEIIAKKIEEITTEQFDYQEIQSDADAAKFVAIQKLTALKAEVEKAEIEAKEAEAKRIEAEKIAQAEREAQIKADAEARAQAEIEEAERKAKETEERIKAESEATIRRVEEAQRLSDERAKQAEENAKLEAQKAVKAEQDRVAKEAQEKAEAEAKRHADKEHRKAVNNAALDGLTQLGVERDQAIEIITAIAKNEIPNISINY